MKTFKQFILSEAINDPDHYDWSSDERAALFRKSFDPSKKYDPLRKTLDIGDKKGLDAIDAYDLLHPNKHFWQAPGRKEAMNKLTGGTPTGTSTAGATPTGTSTAGTTPSSTTPPNPSGTTPTSTPSDSLSITTGSSALQPQNALNVQTNRRVSSTTGGVGLRPSTSLGNYSQSYKIY